ncbi:hypothetical protein [Nocardioides ferulae]|uniref:hypothetical protein n=1 Tax=Nocardioides ferulae TaxID=2340821 RepID=UPI000EAC16F4|nr:hypothetical protein [Nocardioides ferulae]
MTEQTPDPVIERFRSTSGPVWGVVGLLLVAVVVAFALVERGDATVPLVTGALLVGALVWAAMLRPRVLAAGDDLVLRGMLDTVTVPLAAVDDVVVRQVLAVRAGERRYVSSAVGRSLRQSVRAERPGARGAAPATPTGADVTVAYADFVEDRIRQLAEDARQRAGVRRWSAEQDALAAGVRREWAWPEIAGLAGLAVALAVSLAA